MAIEIRLIRLGDHSVCVRIQTDAWNAVLPDATRTIRETDLKEGIEGELTFVATIDEEVVVFVSNCENEWFIHYLYVDPEIRGNGVGTALISRVAKLASSHPVSLKCLMANRGAIELYMAKEFVRTAETGTDREGDWVRLMKAAS